MTIEAWHFICDDACNARTGRAVCVGETERATGKIIPEKNGLHACEKAADAVFWAPGLMVCRVRLTGQIVFGDRKVAASERTVLWMADATETVWEWLCRCADAAVERELRAGGSIEKLFLDCIRARRLWLKNHLRGSQMIERLRGAARQRMRKLCGMDARGKKIRESDLPLSAQRAIKNCQTLVEGHSTPWRTAAARPPFWHAGELGRFEAELLEKMLWKLYEEEVKPNSEAASARAVSVL